jgi:hypothetical protein
MLVIRMGDSPGGMDSSKQAGYAATTKGNCIVIGTRARTSIRTLLGLVAALGLLAAMAMPAAAASQIQLHEPHQGTDSSTAASFEASDCGGFTTGVVWHFILNQYDGDDAGTIVATLEDAGVLSDDATKVVGAQHFYLNTPTDDVLVGAYVEVDGEAGNANLVLSHICHTPTPTPTPTATSGSVLAGNPTPTPTPARTLPNTAVSTVSSVPALALTVLLTGSIGALAFVRVARQPR